MTSSARSTSTGSRTAAYLVAGALATVPVTLALLFVLSFSPAVAAVAMAWITGIVSILKKRQDDPTWDHRTTSVR
ncbi:MAG: hypothetical protein JWP74_4079 [Marmoricola sp.]|nr:hypothetical protein [Marmoricola sp.]